MTNKSIVSNFYNQVDSLWKKEDLLHHHIGYFMHENESMREAQDNVVSLIGKKLGIKEDDMLLDIGCGSGLTAHQITQLYKCNVLGINISEQQIINCMKLVTSNPHIKILKMDANNLTFKDEIFSGIYAIESIMHMNRNDVFKNVYRCLAVGKKFCLCDWFVKVPLSTEEEIFINKMICGTYISKNAYIKMLKDISFKNISFEDWSINTLKTYEYWLPKDSDSYVHDDIKRLTELAIQKLGYCCIECEK